VEAKVDSDVILRFKSISAVSLPRPVASTSGGRISHDFRNGRSHFSGQEMIVYASTRIPRQQGKRERIWEWGSPSSDLNAKFHKPPYLILGRGLGTMTSYYNKKAVLWRR